MNEFSFYSMKNDSIDSLFFNNFDNDFILNNWPFLTASSMMITTSMSTQTSTLKLRLHFKGILYWRLDGDRLTTAMLSSAQSPFYKNVQQYSVLLRDNFFRR